ncbi:MAG: lipid-A-disaccharide synthase [Flavobacteriales bacterium]
MKYYIIAGEASGDLHGSNLIKALKKEDAQLEMRAWGGDLMAKEGVEIIKHYKDLAFMGFIEVIKNIRTIARNLRFCKKDILNYKPDALILIDYPGFNLRIAEFAKQHNIPVHFYISPTVWAWKSSRVHQIKKNVDQLFCIFPFEKNFYKKYDYDAIYVGHPLLDAIEGEDIVIPEKKSDKKTIALLPGSRVQEIKKILPTMVNVAKSFPDYHFKLAVAPSMDLDFIKSFTQGLDIELIQGKTYEVIGSSDLALVTSGTATLETALFNVPEIVCYKTSWSSYTIGKMVVKVDYICIVNLIMNKLVVPEFIQEKCTEEAISEQVKALIEGPKREKMLGEFAELHKQLGSGGASKKVAHYITTFHQN